MNNLTHLSLFTGIGGLDLAAEWAGFKTVGQCEWADYPTKVLEKHWPDVPRWRDIHELSARDFISRTGIRPGELTALSGGFPCQPFSVAGNQRGKEDDRYLWPQMLRVISELHPAYIIGENVPGILHIAADDVCKDLEREGYEVGIFDYEAAAVGAKHRRERFFFVANCNNRFGKQQIKEIQTGRDTISNGSEDVVYSNRFRMERERTEQQAARDCGRSKNVAYSEGERCGEAREYCERQEKRATCCGDVSNTQSNIESGLSFGAQKEKSRLGSSSKNVPIAESEGLQDGVGERKEEQPGFECCSKNVSYSNNSATSRFGKYRREIHARTETERPCSSSGSDWWTVEPNVGRVANGVPSRVDRLKCLGNAVVPYQAYPIFKAIADIELMAAEKKGANPCY